MLTQRRTALAASLLAMSFFAWSGAANLAGAQDKKKGESQAGGALLTKNEELTDKDEKDTHPQQLKNSPPQDLPRSC